jgi:hypothetical protein
MKPTTHLHLVPSSKKDGAVPPLPRKPSWRGASIIKQRDFTFFTFSTISSSSRRRRRRRRRRRSFLRSDTHCNPYDHVDLGAPG